MKRFTIAIIAALALASTVCAQNADDKLRRAEAIIQNYYVDNVDSDTLATEAIRAMLRTLDPHSAYTTPAETAEFTQPLDGKFSGIGIQFNMLDDTVYVIQPTAGGPSERVGILPGDRIVAANDTVIAGRKLTNRKVMGYLRGPKGTEVSLKVKRGDEFIDFDVVRDDIPIFSVDEVFMADPTTGYIRITRFAEETAQEVADALEKLSASGMKQLVIDLSDNGGGYLDAAVELASLFLPARTLVVSTNGRAIPPYKYRTRIAGPYQKLPLVIIANQYSASAAEIFTGAMQDWDRGLVVGRRTFGKGLVQRPFPFPDGSMMRLTVSRYYTPSGRCIQKYYEKGHSEDYQREVFLRLSAGELWDADSIARPDSLLFHTRNNERPVYGGGGIIPDVFVPADTSYYYTYYRDIVAKGVLNRTVIDYVDANRASLLQSYPTPDSFHSGFSVGEPLEQALIDAASAKEIEFNSEQWDRSRPLVNAILKGLVARDLYENGSYYRSVAPLNRDYRAAIDLINNRSRYNSLLQGDGEPSQDQ